MTFSVIFQYCSTSARTSFDLMDLTPHEQMMTFPRQSELSANPLLCALQYVFVISLLPIAINYETNISAKGLSL